MDRLKASLLIPTLNASTEWLNVIKSINEQTFNFSRKIIIDSGSTDNTVTIAKENGFEVLIINKNEFNHGKTRQALADMVSDDICVFLTQDAILASPDSVENIVKVFNNPSVGIAYGRQLPHKNAKTLEAHGRFFNYPAASQIRSFADKDRLGFKVFFCSNSFSAYRKSALTDVGGFPSDSIMGEDALVAARMLIKGFEIAYVADATAYHSHNYTLKEEFRRYFDTRVFHEQNKWLTDEFGKPTGEGIKFVRSEISYAFKHNKLSLPKSFSSIVAKLLGYKLGKYYKSMSIGLLRKLSMHRFYWNTQHGT